MESMLWTQFYPKTVSVVSSHLPSKRTEFGAESVQHATPKSKRLIPAFDWLMPDGAIFEVTPKVF
jgi:hypothetical protein